MTDDDPMSDDDLAAEYVLGVLDASARAAAAERIARDTEFAARVRAWEAHLSGFNDGFKEVTPPRRLKSAIDQALFPQPRPSRRGLWIGLGGLVTAALVAAPLMFWPRAEAGLVAELRADGSDFVLIAEVIDGRLGVALQRGDVPEGRALELWQIVGDAAPVSLGLLEGERVAPAEAFAEGQVIAVSLEPGGGSTTGAPTGPVVALGALKKVESG